MNKEDTYLTTERRVDQIQFGNSKPGCAGQVDIPETCDVKDALILKLEEIDNKIYHLINSNKYFKEEIQATKDKPEDYEDPEADREEYIEYIKENEGVINNFKDQIIRIMNAFLKAGTNVDRDVYPKMKYKGLYMPEFQNEHACDHIDLSK